MVATSCVDKFPDTQIDPSANVQKGQWFAFHRPGAFLPEPTSFQGRTRRHPQDHRHEEILAVVCLCPSKSPKVHLLFWLYGSVGSGPVEHGCRWVIVVARPIEICGHQADRIKSMLETQRFAKLDPAILAIAYQAFGGLKRTS